MSRFARALLAGLFIALGLVNGRLSAAPLPQMSVAAYDSILSRVQFAIEADLKTGGNGAPAALKPCERCIVRVPDSLVFVDNRSLMARLLVAERAPAAERDRGLRDLDAGIADLRTQLRGEPHPAQSRRAVALSRQILSTGAFSSVPAGTPGAWEDLLQKIKKAWDDFWTKHKLPSPSITPPSLSRRTSLIILVSIAVLAFAVLIWFLAGAFQFGRGSAPRGRPSTDLALDEEEAAAVAMRDYARLLELARSHSMRGDYRSAFRLVYVAMLVRLDAEGIVRLDRSKTNWEYLEDVKATPSAHLGEHLRPATSDFDRIWYGFHSAGAADYERILELYDAIHRESREPANAA